MKSPKESLSAIKKQIDDLRHWISDQDHKYYVLNKPTESDYEYDQRMAQLRRLEEQYPEFVDSNSPTRTVRGRAIFSPVKHAVPMLSLDNVYNTQEIKDWHQRLIKTLGPKLSQELKFIVEPKIDGLSCALTYKDGKLFSAATRGDGVTGEDVTENARMIKSIPPHLNSPYPPLIELRGEVFLTHTAFKQINDSLEKSGQEPFVNARNCASGSLRQKDPKITASRNLSFYVHSFGIWEKDTPTSQIEFLEFCKKMYLPVYTPWICPSIEKLIELYEEQLTGNTKIDFDIDGIVAKVNSFEQQKILGFTSKSPRWAIACKFPAQKVESTVEEVIFSVGRTGIITPVAQVKPVFCSGVTISSITLHNFEEIERLGLHIGDRVEIERAGEVIPKILRVTKSASAGKKITPPKKCPSCQESIIKEEDLVAFRCVNPLCPAQLKRSLEHFASRPAMDIVGLGDSAIDQLVDRGMVKEIADLYDLKESDLLKLELFAEKKAANLISQIEASKSKTFDRVLYALGILHVGEKTAEDLAQRFSFDDLLNSNVEDLMKVPDVGPVVAKSIASFFSSAAGKKQLARLRQAKVTMQQPEKIATGSNFSGKTIVFTGELKTMTRDEAELEVKKRGGKASGSVSAKTSFVVAGEAAGSKLKKAKDLGVTVLTEEEFRKMLK